MRANAAHASFAGTEARGDDVELTHDGARIRFFSRPQARRCSPPVAARAVRQEWRLQRTSLGPSPDWLKFLFRRRALAADNVQLVLSRVIASRRTVGTRSATLTVTARLARC